LTTPKELKDHQLQEWLVKAMLISESKSLAPLNTVIHAPKLFPFRFEESFLPGHHTGLEYFRQGLDEEMVLLK
jgi:hypothetical protein